MFGLMNLETGKVWESEGSTFHKEVRDYSYRIDNHAIVAVPKDYINWWRSGHKCEHEGCFKDGCVECHVPEAIEDLDNPKNLVEYLCCDHAFRSGYCICCGEFWGGIEEFDFGNGLCDNCQDACDLENGEHDDIEEYDGWEYGI